MRTLIIGGTGFIRTDQPLRELTPIRKNGWTTTIRSSPNELQHPTPNYPRRF